MDSFKLKYLTHTKKGISRDKNQDSVLIIEKSECYLFIVFDGVSSFENSYLFINEYKKKLRHRVFSTFLTSDILSDILYETHSEMLKLKINGKSTISLLYFNNLNSNVSFMSIGDSRIYIFTNQFLQKITKDDSLELQKNIITKCLGMESLTINDFKIYPINAWNNFLICTDGFYGLMENNLKSYFETFNFKYLKNIKSKLSLFQRGKNLDDSTYIVIKNEISN